MNRRHWLKLAGLVGASLGAGAITNLLAPPRAARAADYKALVCVFLYGGNDGLNTIVPTDATRYGQYAAVRQGLALPQASLVGLGSSGYGLHPSLAALAPAWNEGRLAPVFNVGPLFQPTTKAQFRAAPASSDIVPDNLFSHSDQQLLWESGSTDALTRTGWGGRAADTLATVNPVISVGGNGRFGLSARSAPLVLPEPGATFGAYELGNDAWRLQYAPLVARAAALRALYQQTQDNDLAEAYAAMQRDAFTMSDRLAALIKIKPGQPGSVPEIDNAFAGLIANGDVAAGLPRQLYQVAKLIAGNATVQGNRQIFFAQLGGFDTHGNQIGGSVLVGTHATLLKQVGDALAAFHNAMKALGLADAVTAFTQSDFGRTFLPNNSSGTDHAWGNQHLVLGGAVRGGLTYGSYPTLQLGGPDDVGVESWERQGRWLPTTSVDQYAATLLSWFGATDTQLDAVLPNLRNFGSARRLGFL
ncbi:MAG: DUF1501 domain-containing protein [Piscinibacter sp.]|nr:DUF1501 domain-containing protein [Piscinibacter sp.]